MIKTPITHPDHETIGRWFSGYNIYRREHSLFYCDSYDPRIGFWMSDISLINMCLLAPAINPLASRISRVITYTHDIGYAKENAEYRTNVSKRAIGRAFHQIHDEIRLFRQEPMMRNYRIVLEFICAEAQERASRQYHCAPMPGFSIHSWQLCVARGYEEARRMLAALEGWQ